MAQTPDATDDELDGWVSLEAATRNVVVLLRLRKSGISGNESCGRGGVSRDAIDSCLRDPSPGASPQEGLAAGPGGCGQGVGPAAVPLAGSEAAAESELKSAISLSSTSCQQSAQSTIFASTRRNAGLGQREQSMSSPDESAGEKKDAEQNGDAAKNEKEKAHRDYVARRLADVAAFERRARGGK